MFLNKIISTLMSFFFCNVLYIENNINRPSHPHHLVNNELFICVL